jgi:Flp pilus assembly protein protease CpaA
MFEYLPFAVALGGSSLAAAWDLKTTEIPDNIPHAMIVIAIIFYAAQSYLAGSYWPLLNSLMVGLGLLALGFVMYFTGQWGGGDAKILAAVGFLVPTFHTQNIFLPFAVSYLANVFLVGAAYMIIYALAIALMNRKIITEFFKSMKASKNVFLFGSVILFATLIAANFFILKFLDLSFSLAALLSNSVLPLVATIALFTMWKFAKIVEDVGFKKKVKVSQLKLGDVLSESKVWDGITAKEIKKIRSSGKKYVWVKEGVRFAPAFPLALLFTLYFGDAFLLLMKFLA